MPNWCNNNISITGPIAKIAPMFKAATQDADDETGLLDFMCPMPKALHDTEAPSRASEEEQAALREKYGDTDWYSWRVSHWGTKWEVSSEGLEYSEDTDNGTAEITGWFDSAWAPPIGAMSTYCEANPDVKIVLDYHEPGMAFVGRATIEDGEVDDLYYDYGEANSKTVRDLIGEEMDDMWCISENMAEWEEDNLEMDDGA